MENNTLSEEKIQLSESEEIDLLKSQLEELKKQNEDLKSALSAFSNPPPSDALCYEREDWKESLKEFLSIYPEASSYATQISNILLSDGDCAKKDNALYHAYIKALSLNKTPAELIESEEFLTEYVYPCQKIRDQIISDYVSEIEKSAPSVIKKGGEVFLSPPKKPRTLNEAMRLAEKLLS